MFLHCYCLWTVVGVVLCCSGSPVGQPYRPRAPDHKPCFYPSRQWLCSQLPLTFFRGSLGSTRRALHGTHALVCRNASRPPSHPFSSLSFPTPVATRPSLTLVLSCFFERLKPETQTMPSARSESRRTPRGTTSSTAPRAWAEGAPPAAAIPTASRREGREGVRAAWMQPSAP